MICKAHRLGLLLLIGAASVTGCIGTTEMGLVNADKPLWRRSDPTASRDAIARDPIVCAYPEYRVSDTPSSGTIQCNLGEFEKAQIMRGPPDQFRSY